LNSAIITINTALFFGPSTKILKPHNFVFTFSYPQANTNYRMGVSVREMNYIFPASKALNYSVDAASKTTTSIPLVFYTNNANNINIMVVDLVIAQPGFWEFSSIIIGLVLAFPLLQGR
jgi:hypothetical protein